MHQSASSVPKVEEDKSSYPMLLDIKKESEAMEMSLGENAVSD